MNTQWLLAGRFVVDATPMARGGHADIYHASDRERGNQDVAIKVLRHDLTEHRAVRAAFDREARTLAKLQECETVVRVLSSAQTCPVTGMHFYVMEFVPGGRTLRSLMSGNQHVDTDTALRYIVQLLSALDAAHRIGIVHGDVKPENLLATDESGETRLKLADFLASKRANERYRTTDCSTDGYTAPNVCVGSRATYADDIYPVGVICYELLTGQRPDESGTPPISPERLSPDVSPPIARIVMRALSAHPANRYVCAKGMLIGLLAALDEPRRTESLAEASLPDEIRTTFLDPRAVERLTRGIDPDRLPMTEPIRRTTRWGFIQVRPVVPGTQRSAPPQAEALAFDPRDLLWFTQLRRWLPNRPPVARSVRVTPWSIVDWVRVYVWLVLTPGRLKAYVATLDARGARQLRQIVVCGQFAAMWVPLIVCAVIATASPALTPFGHTGAARWVLDHWSLLTLSLLLLGLACAFLDPMIEEARLRTRCCLLAASAALLPALVTITFAAVGLTGRGWKDVIGGIFGVLGMAALCGHGIREGERRALIPTIVIVGAIGLSMVARSGGGPSLVRGLILQALVAALLASALAFGLTRIVRSGPMTGALIAVAGSLAVVIAGVAAAILLRALGTFLPLWLAYVMASALALVYTIALPGALAYTLIRLLTSRYARAR